MPTKSETNKSVIVIVVLTLAVNGTIGMAALAYCLVFDKKPDATILTAFVGLVNFVLGAVGGMLVKTSPTETTKGPTAPPTPTEVQVVNPPNDPVQTTEVHEK